MLTLCLFLCQRSAHVVFVKKKKRNGTDGCFRATSINAHFNPLKKTIFLLTRLIYSKGFGFLCTHNKKNIVI